MSTSSKLDPLAKQRHAARVALLRNFRPRNFGDKIIMAELALIHNSSHLSGETKHRLFERGANQLSSRSK